MGREGRLSRDLSGSQSRNSKPRDSRDRGKNLRNSPVTKIPRILKFGGQCLPIAGSASAKSVTFGIGLFISLRRWSQLERWAVSFSFIP